MVIEIRGAENSELAVPVNNTLVSHTAFLAADTRLCVLITVQTLLNYVHQTDLHIPSIYTYIRILSDDV